MSGSDLPQAWFLAAIAARSLIILLVLVFGIRLLGKRQVGDLQLIDVVLILLLGNAVQNAMTTGGSLLGVGLVSAGVLLVADRLLGLLLANKPAVEQRLFGDPIVLLLDGHKDEEVMRKEGVSEDELMTAVRGYGLNSLDQVRVALLEDNGVISVIPKESERT